MAATLPHGLTSKPHVLVSGGNGFVASHILSDLIDRGYLVTATVRNKDKAQAVYETHPSWEDRVKFEYVADLTASDAFDHVFTEAAQPFDYVVHAASPVNFSVENIQRDLIDPAIQGTIGILESTSKLGGPSVKRFVLLGSAVAVLNSYQDIKTAGKDYTEADWNPVTGSYAVEHHDAVAGYNVSKVESERAAWAFMKKTTPTFDLVVINPDIIIGPMTQPLSGLKSINETNQFAIHSFLDGTHKQIEGVTFPFYHFVDVRDIARAHVDALTNPAAGSKRIVMVAGLITPQLIVNILHKSFPQLWDRVPVGIEPQILPPGTNPTGWDAHASVDVLSKGTPSGKWEYIGLEKSVVDTVQGLLNAGLL